MQQVHGINYERRVSGVLPRRVSELLYGLHGVFLEMLFPATQVLGRPVAIRATHARHTIAGNLSEQFGQDRCLCVVSVDEYCKPIA
jgi:hypothetical protein